MEIKISCIGSGNMGSALMKSAASVIGGQNISLTDADISRAHETAALIGAAVVPTNSEAAARGDFIFLAVKPQMLKTVLGEISPVIKIRQAAGDTPVLVSMAAGFSIKMIQGAAGEADAIHIPVVRIMPNTPALISAGMTALAASDEVSFDKITQLKNILKNTGEVDQLDEKYFNAVTALSGSGPAFAYVFIEALADGAVRAGLARDKALKYAAHTVLGAAAMAEKTGRHPGELKDMVCSPGGTTIAGLAALEKGAFRGITMQAVEAAWQRAIELENNA